MLEVAWKGGLGKDGSVMDDIGAVVGEDRLGGGDGLGPVIYGLLTEAPYSTFRLVTSREPELWCRVLPNVGKTVGKEELNSPPELEVEFGELLDAPRLRHPPELPGVRGRGLDGGEGGAPGAVAGRDEDDVAEVLLPRRREAEGEGEGKPVTELDET